MTKRTDRVNVLLRQQLGEMIQRDLRDPRLDGAMVSVTEVATSRDLKYATVYISHFGGDDDHADVMAALADASRFLRGGLKSRVDLRQVPSLKFEFDPSIERGARLTSVIESLNPPSDV